jgi:quinoprotein glucose dehydrogenase
MRAHLFVLALLTAFTVPADWPHYGGGPDQSRYSPLTQITPANVGTLRVAWTYDTHDAFNGS